MNETTPKEFPVDDLQPREGVRTQNSTSKNNLMADLEKLKLELTNLKLKLKIAEGYGF